MKYKNIVEIMLMDNIRKEIYSCNNKVYIFKQTKPVLKARNSYISDFSCTLTVENGPKEFPVKVNGEIKIFEDDMCIWITSIISNKTNKLMYSRFAEGPIIPENLFD